MNDNKVSELEQRISNLEKILNKGTIISTLRCPYCGEKYHFETSGNSIFYYCENLDCQKKMIGKEYPEITLEQLVGILNY